MELEAIKRGSDAGSGGLAGADLAALSIKQQTDVLKDSLAGRGNQSSVTAVKADLVWPTLTDDRSDTRDVSQFYEEFEDVCALANNCKGMSFREQLLVLRRGRCRGSRLKTYTNVCRAAWKSGEVLSDPKAVYDHIKFRHLVFGNSRDEKEIRVDSEHALLMKGNLSGHEFAPLFEASIAELEPVGLGKTSRELYLSYLRKMPAVPISPNPTLHFTQYGGLLLQISCCNRDLVSLKSQNQTTYARQKLTMALDPDDRPPRAPSAGHLQKGLQSRRMREAHFVEGPRLPWPRLPLPSEPQGRSLRRRSSKRLPWRRRQCRNPSCVRRQLEALVLLGLLLLILLIIIIVLIIGLDVMKEVHGLSAIA